MVAHVPVGNVPHQVVVNDTLEKLVASNTEDNTISVIDLETFRTKSVRALDVEPEHMESALEVISSPSAI